MHPSNKGTRKRKVLVDLSPAFGVTAGVKQDSRIIFRTLLDAYGTDPCGLIFPLTPTCASKLPFPVERDSHFYAYARELSDRRYSPMREDQNARFPV